MREDAVAPGLRRRKSARGGPTRDLGPRPKNRDLSNRPVVRRVRPAPRQIFQSEARMPTPLPSSRLQRTPANSSASTSGARREDRTMIALPTCRRSGPPRARSGVRGDGIMHACLRPAGAADGVDARAQRTMPQGRMMGCSTTPRSGANVFHASRSGIVDDALDPTFGQDLRDGHHRSRQLAVTCSRSFMDRSPRGDAPLRRRAEASRHARGASPFFARLRDLSTAPARTEARFRALVAARHSACVSRRASFMSG